jgi:hypothetical protein
MVNRICFVFMQEEFDELKLCFMALRDEPGKSSQVKASQRKGREMT